MKTLKNPLFSFGKMALILGGTFLVVWIIIYFLNNPHLSPWIWIFGINGVVWLILGICFNIPAIISNGKYERLKKEGIRYDAQIEQLVPNNLIRVGGSSPVRAECSYLNQECKICLVSSGLFLLNYIPKEDLNAVVYVNSKNPKDYFVEISTKVETNIKFDYDYR